MTDVNELEKGMEQAKKENDRHRDMRSAEGQAALAVLRDFLSNSEDKLRKVSPPVLSISVCIMCGWESLCIPTFLSFVAVEVKNPKSSINSERLEVEINDVEK